MEGKANSPAEMGIERRKLMTLVVCKTNEIQPVKKNVRLGREVGGRAKQNRLMFFSE